MLICLSEVTMLGLGLWFGLSMLVMHINMLCSITGIPVCNVPVPLPCVLAYW